MVSGINVADSLIGATLDDYSFGHGTGLQFRRNDGMDGGP
ncbi:hypothetical protein ACPOL_0068 [Acidisarcina polymorpha]|uniref:Uncharacterized protein n=1 Tax=Acidisarcina polymorpha TaxID=2211140 RepID=A0A2Z5FSK3_9BACT|nr:hypothetical protein ACPOL_0068 [Acidisarcina polymorpha]